MDNMFNLVGVNIANVQEVCAKFSKKFLFKKLNYKLLNIDSKIDETTGEFVIDSIYDSFELNFETPNYFKE